LVIYNHLVVDYQPLNQADSRIIRDGLFHRLPL
jgi:hypothetical protein